jgi:hypothetical protein
MHNNYEIVCIEEDRIFIVPCPVHDLENLLRDKVSFQDYFCDSYRYGYSIYNRVSFPILDKFISQLQKKLGANVSEFSKISSCKNKKGNKRVIFGYKDRDRLVWQEVVLLFHYRNKHPGISGGGGLIPYCECCDYFLAPYNEHIPEQEITGFPSSYLFDI